jgi:hypothetical protein
MRRTSNAVTVPAMDTDHAERVVLDLDPGEPIHGRIAFSTGPAQSFHGWLELASKLERARSEASSGPIAASPAARDVAECSSHMAG